MHPTDICAITGHRSVSSLEHYASVPPIERRQELSHILQEYGTDQTPSNTELLVADDAPEDGNDAVIQTPRPVPSSTDSSVSVGLPSTATATTSSPNVVSMLTAPLQTNTCDNIEQYHCNTNTTITSMQMSQAMSMTRPFLQGCTIENANINVTVVGPMLPSDCGTCRPIR